MPEHPTTFHYLFGCLFNPDEYDRLVAPLVAKRVGKPFSFSQEEQLLDWYFDLPPVYSEYIFKDMYSRRLYDRFTVGKSMGGDFLSEYYDDQDTPQRELHRFNTAYLFIEQHEHNLWHAFQQAKSPSGGSPSASSLRSHPSNDDERATFELDKEATEPAYPSTLTGPDQLAAGATNTYVMTLNGVTDPIKVAYQDVYYHFALYNITALVQKGLKEQAQQQALAGGTPAGSQSVSLLDKRWRDLDRRLDDVKTDTKTAFKGILHPSKGSTWTQSKAIALDIGSLAGTNASAIVALGGFAVGSFVDWVSEGDQELEVIAPKEPGIYLLRGIGTPRPWRGVSRASSVAVKIIEVQSPESMAKDARDASALALESMTLKLILATDPAERDKYAQAYKALHAQLEDLPKAILGQQDTQIHEAQKTAKPEEQAALKTRLGNVHARSRLAEQHNQKFLDPSKTIRPQAAFVSSENSMTIPLLLTMGRLKDDGGLVHFGLSDVTVPDGDFYEAAGNTEEEALWNVVEQFAGRSGYGRGALALTIPKSDKLAPLLIYSRVVSCHPTGPSLLKNRLGDLAIVLAFVSLPVSSVGSAATLVGGAVSAVRLYERFERGTLTWDAETATDLLMVLSAASSTVGSLGKFAHKQVGKHFALVNKFATLREIKDITDALTQIENGAKTLAHAAGVGGLVVGNVSVLGELNDIEKQELAGDITHIEARRASIKAIAGALQNNLLFLRGLRTAPPPPEIAALLGSEPVLRKPLSLQEMWRLQEVARLMRERLSGQPERLPAAPQELRPLPPQRVGPPPSIPLDPRASSDVPLNRPLSPAELQRFNQQTSPQTPGARSPVDAQAQLPVPEQQAATGTDGKPALIKPGGASGTAKAGQAGGATGTAMSTGGSGSGNSGDGSTPPPGTVSPSGAKELPTASQGPALTPEAPTGQGPSSGQAPPTTKPLPESLRGVRISSEQIIDKIQEFGRGDLVEVFYEIATLEAASEPKVSGIAEWVKYVATTPPEQVFEQMSELLEARRLVQEIASDPSLRLHVTDRGEFDIHIERIHPNGAVDTVRQIEVFTEKGPLLGSRQFHKGIIHGSKKASKYGAAIFGASAEATVRVSWEPNQPHLDARAKGEIIYQADGSYKKQAPGGGLQHGKGGNLITELLTDLNKPSTNPDGVHLRSTLLDAINIIDQQGTLLFRFRNLSQPRAGTPKSPPRWTLDYQKK